MRAHVRAYVLAPQRVNALEAAILVRRSDADPTPTELDSAAKLHRLCVVYDDAALKVPAFHSSSTTTQKKYRQNI